LIGGLLIVPDIFLPALDGSQYLVAILPEKGDCDAATTQNYDRNNCNNERGVRSLGFFWEWRRGRNWRCFHWFLQIMTE
jgi:hypothetical protein